MPDELSSALAPTLARLEATNRVRDAALAEGRQLVRLAANAIRALHRGELDTASGLLDDGRRRVDALRELLLPDHPSIWWAGYVQDSVKEIAEAAVLLAVHTDRPLPTPTDLGIEDAPYLNGLAEAASELRRDVLDLLRGDELDRAGRYLDTMDAVYAALVAVDFPDALTGGLRRTTDALRGVLERTRGDYTLTLNQRRLERSIQALEKRV